MSEAGNPTSYAELVSVLQALPLLVREKRRRDGLSIRAAAKLVGVSFGTLNRFETGEDIVLSNAVALLRWVAT